MSNDLLFLRCLGRELDKNLSSLDSVQFSDIGTKHAHSTALHFLEKNFFFNFGYTLSVFKAYLMCVCVCVLLTDVAYFLLLYLFNTIFSQQFFIYLVFPAYDFPTHKLSPAFINLSVAVGILSISSSQFLT